MAKVVTFGEIMMRLSMPGYGRFVQGLPGRFECMFAGAEANVAVSLAKLGDEARFVTCLPDNDLSVACLKELRGLNVDVAHISVVDEGRFGIFFLEKGANQRASRVVYDRDGSSISVANEDFYDFGSAFAGADWFHITGITPALSEGAYKASLRAVQEAKASKLRVSMDLNYRDKLWGWGGSADRRELARRCVSEMLTFVDVVFCNEQDAEDVLGIRAGSSEAGRGKLDIEAYRGVAEAICEKFGNISKVAITLRESISASYNNWGGMLYDAGEKQAYFAPTDKKGGYEPYRVTNIVDRVGAGDAFCAGLIHSLCDSELKGDNSGALRFAVAASCLAHSIEGDFNYSTKQDVVKLAGGDGVGRVVR